MSGDGCIAAYFRNVDGVAGVVEPSQLTFQE
jgi:hypothetical protein